MAYLKDHMEHHVYFWLKEEEKTSQARAEFETSLDTLFTIPLCKSGRWAVPAPVTPRPVLDNSWDYALVMTFDSLQDHDEYQITPVHKTFINGNKHRWEKVLVTDLA